MSWQTAELSDIFDIARGGSPRPIKDYISEAPDAINWVSIKDASESSKYITSTRQKIKKEGLPRSRLVKPGDFLLTNSMSFGRPYIMRTTGCIHDGWLVLSPRNEDVDQDFFFHLLGSDLIYGQFAKLAKGAVVKNLNISLVSGVKVPFPPLPEQERIAAILDKADEIRRKRQEALDLTDQLLRSAFLEMFGDPVTNPMGWEVVAVGDLLAHPPRNGLSPSSKGTFEGEVLTLTAITRGRFDARHRKTAMFDKPPPTDQRVRRSCFLICRGNGNIRLMGAGVFPDVDMLGTLYPDTMIGVQPTEAVQRAYLTHVWKSRLVRRQLEKAARTTSGIHKINQKVVTAVTVPVPSAHLQRDFEEVASSVATLRQRLDTNLEQDLATSLTQRAFRGEL